MNVSADIDNSFIIFILLDLYSKLVADYFKHSLYTITWQRNRTTLDYPSGNKMPSHCIHPKVSWHHRNRNLDKCHL